ncbi:MAG TPA: Neelaredoxin [candidate division WOR-3 bacterium]|uniref:Neelaredoxin n=1 Tax=candidate division WOR-3 bacterium TaxID=2052148 RepID=A0A7C5DB52_UNCW3|nr:class II SORL domain-containing protein [Candidatus Aminicenantes bacterium]HHE04978.1 Neelaredoxin [candidate division WOR-3 bacterium]
MRFGDEIQNLGKEGKRHKPIIKAPPAVKAGENFEIKIKIGEKPHPNTFEHHIRWIQIFVKPENRPMIYGGNFEFGPNVLVPEITLKMCLDRTSTIYTLSYCNIHGVWENSIEIKIES